MSSVNQFQGVAFSAICAAAATHILEVALSKQFFKSPEKLKVSTPLIKSGGAADLAMQQDFTRPRAEVLSPNGKCVSFRVKKKYYDLFASGKKDREYRPDNDYWASRLCPTWIPDQRLPPTVAVICTGGEHPALRFEIEDIAFLSKITVLENDWLTPSEYEELIGTGDCFEIVMGARIEEYTQQVRLLPYSPSPKQEEVMVEQ